MPDDRISLRQLLALLFAALLAPAIGVLPSQTAALAGEVTCRAVLGPLCPPAPGRGGGGAGPGHRDRPGQGVGQGGTSSLFIVGSASAQRQRQAFRPPFPVHQLPERPPGSVFADPAGAHPLAGAQAGEVFYLALAIGLGFSLILGVLQVEPRHILPLWTEDLPGVLSAAVPVLGLFGYVVFAAFLGGNVTRGEGDRRRALWWAAAFCLVLTALQLVCLGHFGPGLTARMDTPFFMMVKGIGIEGTFQRVESVIIALWVFSDLALLNLLAGSCSVLAQSVFSLKERKHAVLPLLLLALAGAWFLFPDAFSLERWMEGPARIGSLLFGFVIPVLLLLVKKLRRQV